MNIDPIRNYMTADPVTVRPDTSVDECTRLHRYRGFRHFPVVEAGGLVGLMKDRDARALAATEETTLPDRTVREALDPAPLTVTPLASLVSTLKLLITSRKEAVVVVEGRRPIGIFTESDAVRLAGDMLDERTRAADIAQWPVKTVHRDARAYAAWNEMASARIRHVVVVGDERKPVGVLSLGDLVEDGIRQTGGLTAGQSIRRPLTTVATFATARSAAAAMARYGMGCLPVVDSDGALVSVITRIDIARALTVDLEEAARRANEEAGYSYRKAIVGLTMDEALAALRSGLATEGFSVVAEIPLSQTLNEKVGAEMRPYRVLLACNPALAVDALALERELGLLLPCHVILYESEDGTPIAAAIEPRALLGIVHRRKPELDAIADETEVRLHRAIDVARGFSERLAASAS